MDKPFKDSKYKDFLKDVKERIYKAQYEALKQVNRELIELYWDIGRIIAEKQKEHGWGKSVVQNLAKDLQKEFPGIKGFSVDNLWRMRKFYLRYKDNEKLAPLVQEISWAKNIVIKIGDFKPEYAGKMQFYLSAINDRVKLKGENPSIGIIVCKGKNRTIVEYALKDVNKPIGVSTYTIKKTLPKQLSRYLPSSKELAESILDYKMKLHNSRDMIL